MAGLIAAVEPIETSDDEGMRPVLVTSDWHPVEQSGRCDALQVRASLYRVIGETTERARREVRHRWKPVFRCRRRRTTVLRVSSPAPPAPEDELFADLLAANRGYAETFSLSGFDGVARAGVAMVTCMDSRIDPLRMIGLKAGDAKILRNPGGRVTDQVLIALVLGVNLLNVSRVLVVQHTRCAMAASGESQLRERVSEAGGVDASWMTFGVITDQRADIADEVQKVRSHPLIGDRVDVGGFLYDVDTGLLEPVC